MNRFTYRSAEAKDTFRGLLVPFFDELAKLWQFILVVRGGFSEVRRRLPELHEQLREKDPCRVDKLESFVAEAESTGFSYLFEVVAVRLWTVLETGVDHLVAFLVQNVEESLTQDVRRIKIALADFIDATEDERVALLAGRLAQEKTSKTTPGVGVFENVLNAIGFGGPVDDNVTRHLMELSEIRHVIVHRNGLADSKVIERCPWLRLNVGDKVRLTEERFSRYYYAVSWYITELMRRRAEREGESTTDEVSLQEDVLKRLRQVGEL